MAADNRALGQFDLIGIPPAPRGVPQVEVTFDIDANGIVSVAAKDKATNKEQTMRIQPSGGLTEADIQKMVRDAEEHAQEDKSRRELVEARNSGEALAHSTERQLAENGAKLEKADREAIEAAIKALRASLTSESASDIQAKSQALAQVAMKIGEVLYAQGGGGESAPSEGSAGPADSGVVDAEFEEVDGQNKKSA